MPTPKAVLFDFDGVIADTLNVHIVAWERTFEAMGLDVTPEQCAKAAEVDDRELLTGILAEKKIEGADLGGWVGRKQETTSAMLRDEPRVFPGVVELVRRLEGEVKLAVVSTALRGDIDAALRAAGIASAFETIVSKEDVKKTKPDPEPYRTALLRLGVAADEAVVIEDSGTGLKAAKAAGIRCVAVGHRQAQGKWVGDSVFVERLADVDEVMGALGFGGRDA